MLQKEKTAILDKLVDQMNKNYEEIELLNALGRHRLPDRDRIIVIVKAIRKLMFPSDRLRLKRPQRIILQARCLARS